MPSDRRTDRDQEGPRRRGGQVSTLTLFLYAHELDSMDEYSTSLRRDRNHAGRTRILWFDVVLKHGPEPRREARP